MVDNAFTRALGEMARDAGVEPLRPDADGTVALTVDGVPMKLTCREGAPDDVYCHAQAGSVAGLEYPDRVLEDALVANFFWRGTDGGTLSVLPGTDTLMLGDRRDAEYFETADDLREYLAEFARQVREWHAYLDASRGGSETEGGAR